MSVWYPGELFTEKHHGRDLNVLASKWGDWTAFPRNYSLICKLSLKRYIIFTMTIKNKTWHRGTWQSSNTQPKRAERLCVLKQPKQHGSSLAFQTDLSLLLTGGKMTNFHLLTLPNGGEFMKWKEKVISSRRRGAEWHFKLSILIPQILLVHFSYQRAQPLAPSASLTHWSRSSRGFPKQ